MKNFLLVVIASIGINFYSAAQSAGDYRSIGSGNWNDPTKWETYNGSSWITASTYPGQNSSTGTVTIMHETEMKIIESVPHAIANLSVSADYPDVISSDCESPIILPSGELTFSAENAASLTVSGDVVIIGQLKIDNQNGAKTHRLFIGGNLNVGIEVYDANCYGYPILGGLETINEDDKLNVTFNTTDPNSFIYSPGGQLSLQDITFDCVGIKLYCYLLISGNATFINGIVSCPFAISQICFVDDATASGGSAASYVEGTVVKIGDDTFTFPIGHEGVYGPVTISGLTGQERFYAFYSRNSGFNWGGITDPGLFSVSSCEYWGIQCEGSYTLENPIDITIGWTTATRCGSSSYITNASDVTLAHYDGNSFWNSHGGTGTGSASNGSVTWNDVTSIGAFTLGNVSTSCETPSGTTTSNITSNLATLGWTVVTGSVNYDVDYRPKNTSSWINAATATASTSVNLSSLSPSVIYEWRVRTNCSSASSLYKLTQFTTTTPPVCNDVYETNNTSSQAKTISLGVVTPAIISSANDVDWFKVTTPNFSFTNLQVNLNNLPADYDLYVYSKSLKLIGSSINSGTSNEVVVYNSNARKATYYIKVIPKSGAFNSSQCYTLLAQTVNSGNRTASHASAPVNEVTENTNKQFLYPNPASEFVYLNFNSATEGSVSIQIVNSIGQLVKQHPVNTIKGHNQFKIQVADIRPGMYILRINKGDLNLTRKFVIAR